MKQPFLFLRQLFLRWSIIAVFVVTGIALLHQPAQASDTNTSSIAGTWYGNMRFSGKNSVERIMVNIDNCTIGSVCGYVHNYPLQCTWELTFDGIQGEAYVFHHSQTLVGGCPASGTSYYTPQPDRSLLRVHITPVFTAEGTIEQRPNTSK